MRLPSVSRGTRCQVWPLLAGAALAGAGGATAAGTSSAWLPLLLRLLPVLGGALQGSQGGGGGGPVNIPTVSIPPSPMTPPPGAAALLAQILSQPTPALNPSQPVMNAGGGGDIAALLRAILGGGSV